MKNQALFSSKDKGKTFKCCLLQFLCVALRVKVKIYFLSALSAYYSKLFCK